MSLLAACDLDRTAIWSPSALALTVPDEEAPPLVCVEVHRGRPLSFTTMAAHRDLAALTAAGVLVPVTTRTVEQYRRVRLPGPPPRHAVCANGGRLLVDGVEDAAWSRGVARTVGEAAPVEQVRAELAALVGDDPGVTKLRVAEDLFCYLVLDHRADASPWAAPVAELCEPLGWVVSLQARKIYALPAALTKVGALTEVAARAGASSYVAAGDSLLDAGMLAAAQEGLVPRGSELAETGWSAPGVALTAAGGVMAGEEVVAWLRDRTGVAAR